MRSDDFEDAAIVCWERAAFHADKAQQIIEDSARLWQIGLNAALEQKALAGAYLALGGYGTDEAAYRELGLPYNEKDVRETEE